MAEAVTLGLGEIPFTLERLEPERFASLRGELKRTNGGRAYLRIATGAPRKSAKRLVEALRPGDRCLMVVPHADCEPGPLIVEPHPQLLSGQRWGAYLVTRIPPP
jgi:hypothetical protein